MKTLMSILLTFISVLSALSCFSQTNSTFTTYIQFGQLKYEFSETENGYLVLSDTTWDMQCPPYEIIANVEDEFGLDLSYYTISNTIPVSRLFGYLNPYEIKYTLGSFPELIYAGTPLKLRQTYWLKFFHDGIYYQLKSTDKSYLDKLRYWERIAKPGDKIVIQEIRIEESNDYKISLHGNYYWEIK